MVLAGEGAVIKPTYGHLLVRLEADERHGITEADPRALAEPEQLVCGELVAHAEIDDAHWMYPRGTRLFFRRHAIAIVPPHAERLVIIHESDVLAFIKPKEPSTP